MLKFLQTTQNFILMEKVYYKLKDKKLLLKWLAYKPQHR